MGAHGPVWPQVGPYGLMWAPYGEFVKHMVGLLRTHDALCDEKLVHIHERHAMLQRIIYTISEILSHFNSCASQ